MKIYFYFKFGKAIDLLAGIIKSSSESRSEREGERCTSLVDLSESKLILKFASKWHKS